MFFLIGGVQPKKIKLEKLDRVCPVCGQEQVYRTRLDHWLSLFFIPLFPVKKGVPVVLCHHCGTHLDESGIEIRVESPYASICAGCGTAIDPDFSFCPWCGRRIGQ
jgi:RNA polymerase subunit RPABC4/transcription elongation factor Spt4